MAKRLLPILSGRSGYLEPEKKKGRKIGGNRRAPVKGTGRPKGERGK